MKRIKNFFDILLSFFFSLMSIITISGVMFFVIHIVLIKPDILVGCLVEFVLVKLFSDDSDSHGQN